MSERFASAVYEGVVTHHRHAPHDHAFRYRMAQLYLDLDEVERVFAGRWLWSATGRNLAEFRRSDYLGPPERSLAEAVRDRAGASLGYRPAGPVRVLTHARYAGIVFNPVTFYYCYQADGTTLDCVVAEITNTPWRERHSYVLRVDGDMNGHVVDQTFPKAFHVSPFMPMEREYRWRFTCPGERLRVHMDVLRDGVREFDAHLSLQRRELTSASLARVLWRYPLMTAKVVGAIHFEALRLWLKRNPIHDHPVRTP
ncbi:chromosome partitioning protein ParA [Luteibacter rhizovicinus DSM 16549]|uniref:Chromosome partitioning protein ParA n=1 Tax=Luteibacter rhizovicinus DSM 16549 TaxID=1440763 RepID=A0A0G9HE54_9GAMM|nr:DUF1365 domain-containing protein [Luteibacter rhizovicinus]APG05316.1 chromosome partitioning protein ParA [Luteibacter rhizovicinus DSM 16549]KLD67938.1 chromosome partitioning protein ParA [Luteibacter rhizovicinus DSM 16549]KLD73658.1 chromosome partitioning protein ParA [Xanthomonas hyacinthi DSM 19077]